MFKIYLIDENYTEDCPSMYTDEQFMNIAESQGFVYSLDKFQRVFNNQALDVDQDCHWIRFICPNNNQ